MSDYKARYEELVLAIENGSDQGIYPCGHLSKEQRDGGFKGSDAYKCGWNDAIIDSETKVKKILAKVREQPLDDERTMLLASGMCDADEDGKLQINMNDTWAWAAAWGVDVPDDKIQEVARLFRLYGFAGLTYWHSCQENNMRSEFHDVNRAIDFVRREEQLIKEEPSSSKRAYTKITYTLGE